MCADVPSHDMVPPEGAHSTGYFFIPSSHMVVDHEIEYHWLQLWKAIIGLLDFLGGKLDELTSTVGIEDLLQEVLLSVFGPLAVAHCSYSPSSCWILHLQKSKPSSRRQMLSTNSL